MVKKDDSIKIRCPYCSKVFVYKPKPQVKGEEIRMVRLIHCPYCESGIQLPNI